jgi:hypothetical protein
MGGPFTATVIRCVHKGPQFLLLLVAHAPHAGTADRMCYALQLPQYCGDGRYGSPQSLRVASPLPVSPYLGPPLGVEMAALVLLVILPCV